MALDRKTIKQIGKEKMRKQWGELLLALVLVDVGAVVASLFTLGIGGLVVIGPLAYGLIYIYYHATQDEKINQKMLLKGFKEKFGESFLASLLLELIIAIPFALSLVLMTIRMGSIISIMGNGIPGGMDMEMPIGYSGGGGNASFIIGIVLWIVVIIVCLYIFYGIVMTIYILMREPNKTAVQAIKKSWAMTKGQKLKLFVFDLSYIGWFILAVLTFGILLIWVLPYYMSSKTVLFNDIYDNSNVDDDPEFELMSEFGNIKSEVGGLKNKVGDFVNKKNSGEEKSTVVNDQESQGEKQTEGPIEEDVPITAEDTTEEVSDETTADAKEKGPEFKVCSNCGATVSAKAKFCNKCGTPL